MFEPGAARGVGPLEKNDHLTGKTTPEWQNMCVIMRHPSFAPVDLERDHSELKVTANHLGSNARGQGSITGYPGHPIG